MTLPVLELKLGIQTLGGCAEMESTAKDIHYAQNGLLALLIYHSKQGGRSNSQIRCYNKSVVNLSTKPSIVLLDQLSI